jgi:cupin superfamily acireductone dioxygenase involved in methionine salvage
MYYAETMADNYGYTNHRVTCLVVMDSPFDSEQVWYVEFHYDDEVRFVLDQHVEFDFYNASSLKQVRG